MSQDLQRRLAQGPITAFQLTVIALCVGLNMLDGFDVLAMSFAASGVKAHALGKARSELYGYPRPETSIFGSNGAFGTFHRALTKTSSLIVGRKGAAG